MCAVCAIYGWFILMPLIGPSKGNYMLTNRIQTQGYVGDIKRYFMEFHEFSLRLSHYLGCALHFSAYHILDVIILFIYLIMWWIFLFISLLYTIKSFSICQFLSILSGNSLSGLLPAKTRRPKLEGNLGTKPRFSGLCSFTEFAILVLCTDNGFELGGPLKRELSWPFEDKLLVVAIYKVSINLISIWHLTSKDIPEVLFLKTFALVI